MTTLQKPITALEKTRALLDQGQPAKALKLLESAREHSLEADNLRGVCLMRMGHADKAVMIYQGLLLEGGVAIRTDAPLKHVVNFATALLLTGNVGGAVATLDVLDDRDHPSVVRLRGAIGRWRKSLGIVQRLMFAAYGASPGKPVIPDVLPGEV